MAKIVSHTWSSARGSIAGITYLTTPSGAIIARQRVKPVNPNSTAQVLARQAMGATATLWTHITDEQRQAWDAAAGVTTFLLGRALNQPGNGRRLFHGTGQLINYLYAQGKIGAPFDGVAPNAVGVPQIQTQILPYAGPVGTTGITVRFFNPDAARNMQLALWHGWQVNDSHKYYKGPWRVSTLIIDQVDAADELVTSFEYKPNALEGQRLYVRIVPFAYPAGAFVGYAKGSPMIVSDIMQTAEA